MIMKRYCLEVRNIYFSSVLSLKKFQYQVLTCNSFDNGINTANVFVEKWGVVVLGVFFYIFSAPTGG